MIDKARQAVRDYGMFKFVWIAFMNATRELRTRATKPKSLRYIFSANITNIQRVKSTAKSPFNQQS